MTIIGDTSRVQLNAFVLDKANIVSKLASPSKAPTCHISIGADPSHARRSMYIYINCRKFILEGYKRLHFKHFYPRRMPKCIDINRVSMLLIYVSV